MKASHCAKRIKTCPLGQGFTALASFLLGCIFSCNLLLANKKHSLLKGDTPYWYQIMHRPPLDTNTHIMGTVPRMIQISTAQAKNVFSRIIQRPESQQQIMSALNRLWTILGSSPEPEQQNVRSTGFKLRQHLPIVPQASPPPPSSGRSRIAVVQRPHRAPSLLDLRRTRPCQ